MNIKLNTQMVYALGSVLEHFSSQIEMEAQNIQTKLTSLNSSFMDPSYGEYCLEYNVELKKIQAITKDLQKLGVGVMEYSKKFSDL